MVYPNSLVRDYNKLVEAAHVEFPNATDNDALMEAHIYASLSTFPRTVWTEKLFDYHFEKGYGAKLNSEEG